MNTRIIASSIMSFSLLIFPFHANMIEKNDVAFTQIFPNHFDQLVMDITIPFTQDHDYLKAITFVNAVSPFDGKYIQFLRLYVDDGDGVFQGMGIDKDMGVSSWASGVGYYYFDALDIPIPQEGLRLFVTVQTTISYSDTALVQLMIPELFDQDNNGLFDVGDKGYFTEKKNNGPSYTILNNALQSLSKTNFDFFAPKAVITSLRQGEIYDLAPIEIKGLAKDQGVSGIQYIEIGISPDNMIYTWQDVSLSIGDVTGFSLVWEPMMSGQYYFVVKAVDKAGNQFISVPISAQFMSSDSLDQEEEAISEEIPVIEEFGIKKGDLVQVQNQQAIYYILNDQYRLVFPNENVYRSWYEQFDTVREVTSQDIAPFQLKGVVTYKPGKRMVKIESDPKVYAVDAYGVLRWITSEDIARELYGPSWALFVDDLDVAFFHQYTFGEEIMSASEFTKEFLMQQVLGIADNVK